MFIRNIDSLPKDNFLSASLLSLMQKAFSEIQKKPVVGECAIQGTDLFYNVMTGICSSAIGKQAEIHKKYIDVHLVLDGQEQIGYSVKKLAVDDESLKDKDLYFGPLASEDFVTLHPGDFAIFFPNEIHKPMSNYSGKENTVTKAIIKIAVASF